MVSATMSAAMAASSTAGSAATAVSTTARPAGICAGGASARPAGISAIASIGPAIRTLAYDWLAHVELRAVGVIPVAAPAGIAPVARSFARRATARSGVARWLLPSTVVAGGRELMPGIAAAARRVTLLTTT